MKAVVLKGINVPLVVEEVPQPEIGPEEALVQIKAASLNKRDWWIQQGKYAGLKFPIILGSDGSGIVTAVGASLPDAWIGQEVLLYPAENWGNSEHYQSKEFKILGMPENGCFASYVRVNGDMLFPKPAHLSFEEAAALPVAGLTAYRALFIRGQWAPGDKVLISGVGGGAGAFALQLAIAAGAEVWVTSGSNEKISQAVTLGARGGANYKEADWAEILKEKAGAFEVIIDSALGEGFAELMGLCTEGARVVFFGGTAGNIPPLNGRPIFWKQINILGTTLGSPRDFEKMLSFIKEKQVFPVIDGVFSMDEAEKAIKSMNAGTSKFGKTILKIDS